jgi:hypothetical protein
MIKYNYRSTSMLQEILDGANAAYVRICCRAHENERVVFNKYTYISIKGSEKYAYLFMLRSRQRGHGCLIGRHEFELTKVIGGMVSYRTGQLHL